MDHFHILLDYYGTQVSDVWEASEAICACPAGALCTEVRYVHLPIDSEVVRP